MTGPDAEAVRLALEARAEDLFRAFWGEPHRPMPRQWRPRDDDARSMVMRGPRRGLWRDHRTGEGGDLLDLVAREVCGLTRAADDFPRTLAEAARWCGLATDAEPDRAALAARRAAREADAAGEAEREDAARAALVEALVARARPVEGTPAAAYLARRGVTCWPAGAFAYLPPVPDLPVVNARLGALVAWARDPSGRIVGGQRIALAEDGTRPAVEVAKPAFGRIGGAPCVLFPRDAGELAGPLYVAEGPETAAAIWAATGAEVWAVFGAGQFAAAPLPVGRRVVLCPDRDSPDSPAARAFAEAVQAHLARGVDLLIAEAPEPAGSKRDLADTLVRAGPEAVRQALAAAARPPEPRDAKGRFTGRGAFEVAPPPALEFIPLAEAGDRLRAAVAGALEDFAAWAAAPEGEREAEAPAVVLAASPGAGKTAATLEALAGFDLPRLGGGDVVFHAPTLALAEEAAAAAERLGAGWHVTRGRSARDPATGAPMCDRAELAERVARAGLSVKASLCEREAEDGTRHECPSRATCAYWAQWADLPPGPALRFEAHAYLPTHGRPDASGRPVALRVVDEKSWPGALGTAELRAEAFARPGLAVPARRRKGGPRAERAAYEATVADAADRAAAAERVLAALRRGESPVAAVAELGAEALESFAKAERAAAGMTLTTTPAACDAALAAELERLEGRDREARKRAAVWAVLAEALRRGLASTERLEFLPDWRGPRGDREPRDLLRVHWRNAPAREVPELHLDADADPEIVAAVLPGARIERFALRPVADVVQITDRTFSNSALARPEVRAEVAALVRAESFADRQRGGGGVLAIATRKAVRAIFEDAGRLTPETPEAEATRIMRETELHGARWIWFGPSVLGVNAYADATTVVVVGREEAPLEALEAQARALFGDGAEPLRFVAPDAEGRRLLPEAPLAFDMADGSGRAIMARAHPDPRVRALQRQGRELMTRQAVERLRLARASCAKRVVLTCKVPVPGLPVDRLATWRELAPGRLEVALAEAGGVLRLSAAGLAADAPWTFATERAAEDFMRRGRRGSNPRTPLLESYNRRAGVFPAVALVRLEGQRGRPTPCLFAVGGDPRAAAAARFGPLAAFDLMAPADAPPAAAEIVAPAAVAPVAMEIVAPRPEPPPRRLVWAPLPGAVPRPRPGLSRWRVTPEGEAVPVPAASPVVVGKIAPRPRRRLVWAAVGTAPPGTARALARRSTTLWHVPSPTVADVIDGPPPAPPPDPDARDADVLAALLRQSGPMTPGAAGGALRWGASRTWRAAERLRAEGRARPVPPTGVLAAVPAAPAVAEHEALHA